MKQLKGLPGRTTHHFYIDFPTRLKWSWKSCSQLAPTKMKRLWFVLNLKHEEFVPRPFYYAPKIRVKIRHFDHRYLWSLPFLNLASRRVQFEGTSYEFRKKKPSSKDMHLSKPNLYIPLSRYHEDGWDRFQEVAQDYRGDIPASLSLITTLTIQVDYETEYVDILGSSLVTANLKHFHLCQIPTGTCRIPRFAIGSKVEKKVNAKILGKEPLEVLQANSKESLLAYKGYAVLVDNPGSLSRGEGYPYWPIVETISMIQE